MGQKYGEEIDRNAKDQKLRWSLVPTRLLDEVVRVFMHGAREYGENNWKICDNPEDYIDAAMRHVVSLHRGEIKDRKSGYKHSAHIIASLLINDWLIEEREKRQKMEKQIRQQQVSQAPESTMGGGLGQILGIDSPFRG